MQLLPIVLTGMPGSGKSTVGKLLAETLNLPFIDSDIAIETRIGLPCTEIFEREGEAFFRNLEYEEVEKALKSKCVLATGGGAFIQPKTRQLIQQYGYSIFIDVPLEALQKRLEEDFTRPLLLEDGALEKLYNQRLNTYKLADARVTMAKNDTVKGVVNECMAQL